MISPPSINIRIYSLRIFLRLSAYKMYTSKDCYYPLQDLTVFHPNITLMPIFRKDMRVRNAY